MRMTVIRIAHPLRGGLVTTPAIEAAARHRAAAIGEARRAAPRRAAPPRDSPPGADVARAERRHEEAEDRLAR